MRTTKHCLTRMSQRGLTKQLLDFVFLFGKDNKDKIILDRKTSKQLIKEIDYLRKFILKIVDKGGVTVVTDNKSFITAYNTDSYKKY